MATPLRVFDEEDAFIGCAPRLRIHGRVPLIDRFVLVFTMLSMAEMYVEKQRFVRPHGCAVRMWEYTFDMFPRVFLEGGHCGGEDPLLQKGGDDRVARGVGVYKENVHQQHGNVHENVACR